MRSYAGNREAQPGWAGLFDVLDHAYQRSVGQPPPGQDSEQLLYQQWRQALEDAGAIPTQIFRWEATLAARSTTPRFAAQWASLPKRSPPEGCASWIHLPRSNTDLCNLDDLPSALEAEQFAGSVTFERLPELDHNILVDGVNVTAILYADGTTFLSQDLPLHHALSEAAQKGQLEYVLRWAAPDLPASAPSVPLSGYGASLDLKKVDYLVLDDRPLEHDATTPLAQPKLNTPKDIDHDPTGEDGQWLRVEYDELARPEPSQADALTPLSQKVSWLVARSSDPVRALRTLVSDLPNHVTWIQSLALTLGPRAEEYNAFLKQVTTNQHGLFPALDIPAEENRLWLNGLAIPLTESESAGIPPVHQDVQALLRTLQQEDTKLDCLLRATNRSSDPLVARQLLNDKRILGPASASFLVRFNASDAQLGEQGARIRATDILRAPTEEQQEWERSLEVLTTPPSKTQVAPLFQRNLFEVVYAADLRSRSNVGFMAEAAPYISANVPVSWSIVPTLVSADGPAEAVQETHNLARILAFVSQSRGPKGVLAWCQAVTIDIPAKGEREDLVSLRVARRAAHAVLDSDLGRAQVTKQLDALHRATDQPTSDDSHDPDGTSFISAAQAWAQRLGVAPAPATILAPKPVAMWPGMRTPPPPPSGIAFVNGRRRPVDGSIIQFLSISLGQDLEVLSDAIQAGDLPTHAVAPEENDPVEGFWDRLPGILPAYSPLIAAQLAPQTYQIADVSAAPTLAVPASANVSLVVVADLDSVEGQQLLRVALDAAQESAFELGVVHNADLKSPTSMVSNALYHLLSLGDAQPDNLGNLVRNVLDQPKESDAASTEEARDWWDQARSNVLADSNYVPIGTPAILLNGQVFRTVNAHPTKSEILALVGIEESHRAMGLRAAVTEATNDNSYTGAELTRVRHAVFASMKDPFAPVTALSRQGTVLNQVGSEDGASITLGPATAPLKFTLLLDPVSDDAPQWAATLAFVSSLPDVQVQLVFNPTAFPSAVEDEMLRDPRLAFQKRSPPSRDPEPPELPTLAKRFTRHLVPELTFDAQGRRTVRSVHFGSASVPQNVVLTLALQPPPAWHTMPSKAVYDLDNLRLSALPADQTRGVEATYSLTGLLVQGHAMDFSSHADNTPSGMELLLQHPPNELLQQGDLSLDTIVMDNLNYFQFRAQPGQWALNLRPGRSSEVYCFAPIQNGVLNNQGEFVVQLLSLEGITIQPRFVKQPGMQDVRLVEDPEAPISSLTVDQDGFITMKPTGAQKSVWSTLTESVRSLLPQTKPQSRHADINIFTIASGHLYERFMSIMILSVLSQTEHSVKFWFVEDFLSPSFKELLPHLSERYGFQYELISYAWPHWLRKQSEKQRTIWGYKILFLDVLFPLDLDRILFVDADQIVRTDLYELSTLDLQGKPYAYPPMGDDSYDMDGFRFWKTGYWKSFLRGKPYHISALYAVDLVRFRQLAAGDRLRAHYQALSADENSLANLDQDLPNSLQFSLPIYTLPQEWLWCETWCSSEWLHKAKTIDLCSNPKTKEPKLDRARRQMPEWSVYDAEVAKFVQQLKANQTASAEGEPKPESGSYHTDL